MKATKAMSPMFEYIFGDLFHISHTQIHETPSKAYKHLLLFLLLSLSVILSRHLFSSFVSDTKVLR